MKKIRNLILITLALVVGVLAPLPSSAQLAVGPSEIVGRMPTGDLDGLTTEQVRDLLDLAINVKDKGALGDGVDDSTAVENALAAASAGDIIYFPPGGVYVLDSELIPTVDNLTFYGPGATIRLHQTPVGTEMIAKGVAIWIDQVHGTRIEGIRFEGPATATGYAVGLGVAGVEEGSIIHIQASNDTEVNRCEFIMNGTFKGGTVFVKGNGGVPSLRTKITNNYAEKADEFTYAYSFTSHTTIENNEHVDGFENSYRGTGNGSIATFTGVSNLSFNDNGVSDDTIVRGAGSFITDNFRTSAPFDTIEITGSASNNLTVVPTAVTATIITLPTGTLAATESNTSATVKADRDSKNNRVINNTSINSARMCVEDFETSENQRMVDTHIIRTYCLNPVNIGISQVGHKSTGSFNRVINPTITAYEIGDAFATVTFNRVEHTPSSPNVDTSVGYIIDHTDARDADGTTVFTGNEARRFDVALKLQAAIGTISASENVFINSKRRGIDGSAVSGETASLVLDGNIFYYDIRTDEHAGIGGEVLRVAIGNPQISNFIASYNEITYADSAGGGSQANIAILLATELDDAQYIGTIVNDNGVQSGPGPVAEEGDVEISSVGGTPDGIVIEGGNLNTTKVDLSNTTNTEWRDVKHTGVKTGFSKTSLLEFTQTSGVGTDADLLEKTLLSDTVPANILDYTGKAVKIQAWGNTAANGDTKNLRLNFGATELYASGAVAANNEDWYIEAIITRTGAATQDWIVTGGHFNGAAIAPAFGTASETLSTDTAVEVTGQNGNAAANDIVAEGFTVEYLD